MKTMQALAAAAVLLAAAPAVAETLYRQAPNFNSSFSPSHQEGWRTYDEFRLDADSAVTRLDWWGLARTSLWDDAGLPSPLSFTIEVYASGLDDDGSGVILPYARLDLAPIAAFTVDALWEDVGPMQNSALPVQHYWYEFDTPVDLPGDEVLWLGVHSSYPAADYGWYWLRGAATGEPYPVYNWAKPAEDLHWIIFPDEQGGNFAFELTGQARSATPEPGAWLLMLVGTGLAGAGLRRRRATHAPPRATLGCSPDSFAGSPR